LDADSSETIIPQVGVPIQIPSCFKAQGCRHACVSLASYAKSCYVETKYDGHRMQIHVDLTLPLNQQVKIFNKSRKNGTKDREEIIPYVHMVRR
jgi:DNA ligase 4